MVPNGWKRQQLGSLAKIYDGTHQTPNYVDEGIPFYSVEHVTANQFEVTKFISEFVFEKESSRVRLERDDILMTRIGDIGTARLIDWDVKASFYVSLALIKHGKDFFSGYLANYINGALFRRELWKRTIHVAFPKKINLGEIGNCEVLLPPLPEQKKIAQILSTWDKAITTTEQLLANSQQQKKALMQQLLTGKKRLLDQNGVRFEGEWRECLVEDFFDVGSSKRVLQKDWQFEGVPFYRTRELVSLSKNEPFRSEIFISEELFSDLSEKYGCPQEGDFLVSGVGTLGISYQVKNGDRFYFKDGNVLWFKIKAGVHSDFFRYSFQSDFMQDQITAQASVTTVGTFTIKNAKKTKFLCPPSVDEQQKIAAVLTAADQEITTLKNKLDALKQEKKALMQQLLTGKRRVKVEEAA